jgi:hypothetical protein
VYCKEKIEFFFLIKYVFFLFHLNTKIVGLFDFGGVIFLIFGQIFDKCLAIVGIQWNNKHLFCLIQNIRSELDIRIPGATLESKRRLWNVTLHTGYGGIIIQLSIAGNSLI